MDKHFGPRSGPIFGGLTWIQTVSDNARRQMLRYLTIVIGLKNVESNV